MTPLMQAGIYFDRTNSLTKRIGIGRSAHYEKISQQLWVHPVKIGLRASGYPSHETDALIAAQIAGKSNDEIRALVKQLVASRERDPVAVYFASGKTPEQIRSTIRQLQTHLKAIGEAA